MDTGKLKADITINWHPAFYAHLPTELNAEAAPGIVDAAVPQRHHPARGRIRCNSAMSGSGNQVQA